MRRALFAIVAATVLAAVPSGVSAYWAGRGHLGASGAWLPTVASNARNDVVAAWYQSTGEATEIHARISHDGGRHWTAGQDLGAAVVAPGDSRPIIVRAAVDARGDAIVVWNQVVEGTFRVVAAEAPDGRAFRAAAPVSPAGDGAYYPDVAATGNRFAVAWTTEDAVKYAVVDGQGAVTVQGTAATGRPAPDQAAVAGDGGGRLAFAWNENNGVDDSTLVARTTIGGRASLATVSTSAENEPLGLAVSRTGRTTIVWTSPRGDYGSAIEARSAAWGSKFGPTRRLSGDGVSVLLGGGGGGSRGVGVDASGRVSAVWVEWPEMGWSGGGRVKVATSTSSGYFRQARTLQSATAPWTYERPAIAVSPAGDLFATWTRYRVDSTTGDSRVWGATARTAGRFSTPRIVSTVGGDASAVAASDGRAGAVCVWEYSAGTVASSEVQYRRWVHS